MKVNELYKPKLHYTSEFGWINDPNGFSVYKDRYHLFAQHNPYDTKWGPMHWSHAVSDDLVKWDHKPIALAPTESYELDMGCFSGTAIEENGKHILMYTSCKGKVDGIFEQLQCIAVGDGENYEKLPENPVIKAHQLPDFVSSVDFRDPKLFKIDDEFFVLLGAKVIGKEIGTMLLYKSKNLTDWEYVGEVLRASENGEMGVVFECPDIFKLDNKYFILTSPINMPQQGDKYCNVSSAVYFVGDMDFNNAKFSTQTYDEIDFGFDFYAPQTLEKKNGDRIMIAWAQMWGRNMVTHELSHGWAGAMTIPRKLSYKNNRLYQEPVESLKNYHGTSYDGIDKGSEDSFRLKVSADLSDGENFEIELLKTGTGSFKIIYDKTEDKLIIDRKMSLFKLDNHEKEKYCDNTRKVYLGSENSLELDIIVDKSLIEIFINGGKYTMTSNYYKGKGKSENLIDTDYKISLEKIDLDI